MLYSAVLKALRPRFEGMIAQGQAISNLPHAGVKGRLRELLVRELIEPFVPPEATVVTGTIVAAGEQRRVHRNQDDVVLFSRSLAPLIFGGAECIIPIEGVLAHIEVNSRLTGPDVIKAVSAAAEISRLPSGASVAPAGILFSFGSNSRKGASEVTRLTETLRKTGYAPSRGEATSPVQIICVASRGTWFLADLSSQARGCGWWFVPTSDCRHLFAFVSLISNTIYQRFGVPEGIGRYFLDLDWVEGPAPSCPVIEPPSQEATGILR